MYRPRIIPVLLLRGNGLVKSIKFKNHRYIGDPINAVKLFNDLHADELVFLDIAAGKEGRTISVEFIKNAGEEANMPFAAGGGINTVNQIRSILNAGAEKVVINSYAAIKTEFIRQASDMFGSSAITVCIDVKKNIWGKEHVWIRNGTKSIALPLIEFVLLMEHNGAGELIIQSIERDGTMAGYDIDLIRRVSEAVTIPVIALGGAASISHMKDAFVKAYANGLAAGSMFVYHGSRQGVLINYPTKKEIQEITEPVETAVSS